MFCALSQAPPSAAQRPKVGRRERRKREVPPLDWSVLTPPLRRRLWQSHTQQRLEGGGLRVGPSRTPHSGGGLGNESPLCQPAPASLPLGRPVPRALHLPTSSGVGRRKARSRPMERWHVIPQRASMCGQHPPIQHSWATTARRPRRTTPTRSCAGAAGPPPWPVGLLGGGRLFVALAYELGT